MWAPRLPAHVRMTVREAGNDSRRTPPLPLETFANRHSRFRGNPRTGPPRLAGVAVTPPPPAILEVMQRSPLGEGWGEDQERECTVPLRSGGAIGRPEPDRAEHPTPLQARISPVIPVYLPLSARSSFRRKPESKRPVPLLVIGDFWPFPTSYILPKGLPNPLSLA